MHFQIYAVCSSINLCPNKTFELLVSVVEYLSCTQIVSCHTPEFIKDSREFLHTCTSHTNALPLPNV